MASKSANSDTCHSNSECFGYEIGKKIGRGAYSTVRLAYSFKYEKMVALKIIHKRLASNSFIDHFIPREMNIVKGLRHPNIIQYIQCIETDHRIFIAMEFANNGTMFDLLAVKEILSEADSRFYFRQLISAMEYCHSKQIAHRDLKLENLLLTDRNCLKVSDFSFARLFNRYDDLSKTYCGSDDYLCPEILKQEPYDPMAADCWSCGVILYAISTGFLPFNDSLSIAQLIRVIEIGVIFPVQLNISESLKKLINKFLSAEKYRIKMSNVNSQPWMQ